ncbi:hypothetical protein HIM_04865 [Hirsutella minnesotensis 3608]|uniref:Uncharacterized protein n=1 Tax=Hirsutella minnesotensis 3608 TaxID=1043627 RepID=A0A0F7ZUZ2_9HYPO|nr:hypothetical protein HIM_04865 [Hirsutella minnesotensis 3608]
MRTTSLVVSCLTLLHRVSCLRYPPFELTEQKLRYAAINLTELTALANTALSVDDRDPPYADMEEVTEPTCLMYKASCGETSFWHRKEVSSGLRVTDIAIVPTYGPVHAHRMRKAMKFTDTIAEADVRSVKSGWRVTGELSLGLALGQKDRALATFGLKLASETRREVVQQHDTRTGIQREIVCDAGYQCWSELWTFVATVAGACTVRSMARCADKTVDICQQTGWDLCAQYGDFKARSCGHSSRPPTSPAAYDMLWPGAYKRSPGRETVPCQIQFPLSQANGKLYQLSLGFENKLEVLQDESGGDQGPRRRRASSLEEPELKLLYTEWI